MYIHVVNSFVSSVFMTCKLLKRLLGHPMRTARKKGRDLGELIDDLTRVSATLKSPNLFKVSQICFCTG